MFRKESGNWTEYRQLPNIMEIDFHAEDLGDPEEWMPYWKRMEEAKNRTLNALKKAFEDPAIDYVLFTHGLSTSHRGKTTSRSVVRGVMKSKEATPYIIRKESIEHVSVFLAKIKSQRS